jgi:hypothetical protein
MPEDECRLEGKDRLEALERLTKRLDVKGLPSVVADNLDHHLLWDAYHMDEEVHWEEVEREARKLLDVYYDPSGRSRPPAVGMNAERRMR